MRKKLLASLRISLTVLLTFFATNFASVAAAYATTPSGTTTTLAWAGNGPADPQCLAGQEAHFHWVLTPGGQADITSGTLTVKYSAGSNDTVTGYFPNGTNGNGAMQFNTQQAAPAHVTSASVTYTYTGTQKNPNLVISDSWCTGTPVKTVTPLAPTLVSNLTCNGDGSISIPSVTGVVYKINGKVVTGTQTFSTAGTVTVTAEAASGYTLAKGSTTSWTFTFTQPTNCLTTVRPKPVLEKNITCKMAGSYTIPSVTGVVYKINGKVVAAGTYTVTTSKTITVTAVAAQGYVLAAGSTTTWHLTFTTPEHCKQPPQKITICHATAAFKHPYVEITVNVNAADGIAGNSGHQADHFAEHNGPLFDPTTMHNGGGWGDIIPPIPGVHNGLNWTAAGQAIYNNHCMVTVPTVHKVHAVAPTMKPLTCEATGSYTIPSVTGVQYEVNGVVKAAGTYTVTTGQRVHITAEALAGYRSVGRTSWTFVFKTPTNCEASVTATTPTMKPLTCTMTGSYTIPTTTGVQYKVNGMVKAAGTYTVSSPQTVTITAVATSGFTLTGTTSWTFSFTAATNCATDVCPNITGTQTTVPAGFTKDNTGNCVQLGRGGGGETPTTPSGGQVLGASTSVTTPTTTSPQLVNTGDNALMSILASLSLVTVALGAWFVNRRPA